MKALIDFIESHPTTYGVFAAIASLAFPQIRRALKKSKNWMFSGRRIQQQILADVQFIKKEMQFNGGNSLRDIVSIQNNRQKAQFWRSIRPSVEMGLNVKVDLVSETACHLFRVSDPQLIMERNWLNCVAAGVDDFLQAYEDALKFEQTALVYPLPLKTNDGEPLGKWEIRLSLITPKDSPRPKFSGYFKPVDEIAKTASEGLQ